MRFIVRICVHSCTCLALSILAGRGLWIHASISSRDCSLYITVGLLVHSLMSSSHRRFGLTLVCLPSILPSTSSVWVKKSGSGILELSFLHFQQAVFRSPPPPEQTRLSGGLSIWLKALVGSMLSQTSWVSKNQLPAVSKSHPYSAIGQTSVFKGFGLMLLSRAWSFHIVFNDLRTDLAVSSRALDFVTPSRLVVAAWACNSLPDYVRHAYRRIIPYIVEDVSVFQDFLTLATDFVTWSWSAALCLHHVNPVVWWWRCGWWWWWWPPLCSMNWISVRVPR